MLLTPDVSGWRGAGASIRLRGKPLRRDRLDVPASSVQHGEPWSLDEVAGVREPARSNKKRHTVKVCLFLLNEADGARTRDLSRDRAAL